MKSILTLLTAFVLFGLALTSTSCKKCSKEEPINRGGDADNTPFLDTTTSSSTIDGNSKAPGGPTPPGDSTTVSDDKKGGGSGATDEAKGGIPIPSGEIDEVPVTLEDKRKAVEKMVCDVVAGFMAMHTLRNEAMAESISVWNSGGVDNIIQARNKMKDATAVHTRMQTKTTEVKTQAKKLHIDGDIVAIALVAKADEYVVETKNCLMIAQWQVEMAALRCSSSRERVKFWIENKLRESPSVLTLCPESSSRTCEAWFAAFTMLSDDLQVEALRAKGKELNDDDVNAIIKVLVAREESKIWNANRAEAAKTAAEAARRANVQWEELVDMNDGRCTITYNGNVAGYYYL
jgi:hypothetical protein